MSYKIAENRFFLNQKALERAIEIALKMKHITVVHVVDTKLLQSQHTI